MHDLMIGRARVQADGAAKAAAAAAHMTFGGAAHGLDCDERGAIDHPHPALWERRDKAQACSSTPKCTGASLASKPKTPFTGQR